VLLGGILTQWAGWRWVLFVNVPIGLFIIWQSPFRLAESRVEDQDERSLDIAGAVTVTAGLAMLVFALVEATNSGWATASTAVRLLIAVALLASFVVIEMRTRKPLVPFSIFRIRTLLGSNIVGLLIGMSLFSMFFIITLYLQQVLGYSALRAGLSYLPLAIAIVVSAGVSSQLVTRLGFKPVLITGMLLVTGALAWFSQVSASGNYLHDVLGPSLLAGVGLGASFVPVTIGAMTGTARDEAGLASGLINTSQQMGGALGLAILASVANTATKHAISSGSDQVVALTHGFAYAFAGGAIFAFLGAVLAFVLISSDDSKQTALTADEPVAEPASA
jgi:MFS family permease